MTALGKWLNLALERPEEWWSGEFTILHKPTKACFWVGHGPLFFNGYEGTPAFLNLYEKITLYYKMKRYLGVPKNDRTTIN